MVKSDLSFKEYLASKDALKEAADATSPKRTAVYDVRKYCNLAVGETKEEKQSIPLKPKHQILVDWLYEDVDNPTPISIRIKGPTDVPEDESFAAFWRAERLAKWLEKNANEQP